MICWKFCFQALIIGYMKNTELLMWTVHDIIQCKKTTLENFLMWLLIKLLNFEALMKFSLIDLIILMVESIIEIKWYLQLARKIESSVFIAMITSFWNNFYYLDWIYRLIYIKTVLNWMGERNGRKWKLVKW